MATAETYKPISWIFLRSDGLTIWTTSDTFRIRGHSVPKDPKTTDQRNSRGFLCEAKRQWATLSETEKAAWKAFARACIHTNKREQPVKGRGIDAFMGASITRQTAGLGAMPALPEGNYVPAAPKALDLLPGNNARELAFRIEHKNTSLSSHAMLVRMTPTGKSAACKPYKSSLRHVRGVGPESLIALPESGETVRISDTRFELEPGCIYAVEVRIMRLADGVVSEAFYSAAVREETPSAEALESAVETNREDLQASPPAAISGTAETTATAGTAPTEPAAQTSAATQKSPATQEQAAPAEVNTAEVFHHQSGEISAAIAAEADFSTADVATRTGMSTPLSMQHAAGNAGAGDEELDALARIRKAMREKSSLDVIADRRGSRYFPSAYVLDKDFNPKGFKKREKRVCTNIGESNGVGADDPQSAQVKTVSGGNKDFGKYMAMIRYVEKNFM